MTDYRIQSSSQRCAKTGRELQPGEKFFSVLFDDGAALIRQDICSEAWQGPPENAYSFWMGRVPPRDQHKKPQLDDSLLGECFQRLAGETEPQKVNFRYIVALLLMRRRRLKFEEVAWHDGVEFLVLRDVRSRTIHEVLNPQLTEPQLAEAQSEVQRILGI
jgi:hypothetical protein